MYVDRYLLYVCIWRNATSCDGYIPDKYNVSTRVRRAAWNRAMYIHFYMVQIAIFPSRDFTWAQPVPRSSAARLDGGRVERFSMSTPPPRSRL